MADVRIRKAYNVGQRGREIVLEVTGMEAADLDGDKLRRLFNATFPEDAMTVSVRASGTAWAETDAAPEHDMERRLEKLGQPATTMRAIRRGTITPAALLAARDAGHLDDILDLHTKIDIPTDTGETITAVCADVTRLSARFVFKDCWGEAAMNYRDTNKGGYFKSKGRKYVLVNIWPHIAREWREIIAPRRLVEIIDGKRVEYSDPLWLPSATDMFGPPAGRWWNEEEDSYQLPIFARERDRVKECHGRGTHPWWLRSVYATNASYFCVVNAGGSAGAYHAYPSLGFAPGFDI